MPPELFTPFTRKLLWIAIVGALAVIALVAIQLAVDLSAASTQIAPTDWPDVE